MSSGPTIPTIPETPAIERQLERLFARFDLNEGFELDIVVPRTWLAECGARAVIEQRLAGVPNVEFLDIRLALADDVLGPARAVADAILATQQPRILLVHIQDDGQDLDRWQPFFRRLNEVRNAIAREFVGNLVLLIAPPLVIEFAGEAPDVWSIGSSMVVGVTEPEELEQAMFEALPQLLAFTRDDDVTELAGLNIARDSRVLRARQRFEWSRACKESTIDEFSLARPIPEGIGIAFSLIREKMHLWLNFVDEFGDPLVRKFFRLDQDNPLVWSVLCPPQRIGCVLAPNRSTRSALIDGLQEVAASDFIILVCPNGLEAGMLASLRRGVDLVVILSRRPAWDLEGGQAALAPCVWLPENLIAWFEDQQMKVRPLGGAFDSPTRRWSVDFDGPGQLWLPGIDRDSFGSAVIPTRRAPLNPSDRADTSS